MEAVFGISVINLLVTLFVLEEKQNLRYGVKKKKWNNILWVWPYFINVSKGNIPLSFRKPHSVSAENQIYTNIGYS